MLTRQGIVRLLTEAGVDVAGEAGDATSLLERVRTLHPDVAIVDIRMPPTHTDEGLVAADRIRQEMPDTGVLVLSQYVDSGYAMRLIADHPEHCGYLLKERVFDVAVLIDALQRVVDGETVIDPTVVSRLLARKRDADSLDDLTARERETLALVAEGLARIERSRSGYSSPSGPSRPTSSRSSTSSASKDRPRSIGASWRSSLTCAADERVRSSARSGTRRAPADGQSWELAPGSRRSDRAPP